MSKKARQTLVSAAIILLATVVTYLPYFKNTFGIDTSTMIMNQRQMLDGYLSQGRFGIVWLFELFIRNYNNQIVPFIVVPLLAIAGIYLYYILRKFDGKPSNIAAMLFSIAFINNPVVYSQLYFKMQAIHIVVGLFCVLIGMHLCLSSAKNSVKIIGGSLLFGFSLLIYQVFAFFIFSMILLCLLLFKEERKHILQSMLPSWIIAGIIYIVSYVVASMTIHYSAYGSETYMMWNKLSAIGGLQKVGALFIGIVTIAYVALLLFTLAKYRAGKNIDGLLTILLVVSILTFNMAFGNVKPAPRVYFGAFSVVFAGILYLWAKKGAQLKYLSVAFALLSMVFTFSLSQKANQSYNYDKILTQNVVEFSKGNNVSKDNENKTNIVFIGDLQVGNQGIIRKFQDIFITGATRTSFFQFDPALTSVRPYDFMKIQGYDFKIPDQALRVAMTTKYSSLPDYPDHESMKFDSETNTIVVKLSN